MRRHKAVWMLMSVLALMTGSTLGARAVELTPAPPPVLTIDDGAPHAAIIRFEPFSTGLTASVKNPPTSTDEATITGPQWLWSGGRDEVRLTSLADSPSNNLDSPLPTLYCNKRGWFFVTVNCTARYTKTDKKTNEQTFIDVSGGKSVQFFIRWPVSNVLTGQSQHTTGPPGFGQDATYNFDVLDNMPTPQPYGYGRIHEAFAGYTPNPAYAAELAKQGAPGPEFTTDGPVASFSDHNEWSTSPRPPNANWDYAKIAETAQKGPNDFWFSFGQTFECVEQKLPSRAWDQKVGLTPDYTVTFNRDNVVRR